MITKKELETELQNLEGLNGMIQAYEEIAASRIMNSRRTVLANRVFIDEINEIFKDVISSYKKEAEALLKNKKNKNPKELTFLNKNNKTLYLMISANAGLYGSLVKKTFDLFVENSGDENSDRAIIGKLGLSMWQQTKKQDKYYYFDFPDQNVDEESLKKILDFIVNYQKIIVFYGKFQNLVTQNATYSDISGNTLPTEETNHPYIKYYFEPSLEKILEFFEKQIFASIFEQTVREAQLAKIASRLTTLDKATENINKKLVLVTTEKNRNGHRLQNKKQLETFNSRVLWGKI